MLKQIRAVTTTAADLKAVEDAYSRYLGYRTVQRGKVSHITAKGWGAPAVAGKNLLVMMPESGEQTYLRFVEQTLPAGFKPFTTYGWNATEIAVQDTDALIAGLQGSPFTVLFPPRDLSPGGDIRAAQVLGPAGEVLYLTTVGHETPGRDLHTAKSFVDRCFIAVAGGPDLEAMRSFYRDNFNSRPGPTLQSMLRVLSSANALPIETKYPICTIPLGGGTLIELDGYPDITKARARPPGGLPPGMAIVTFEHPRFESFAVKPFAPPHDCELPPYRDHKTVTVVGAAGELIELIEV